MVIWVTCGEAELVSISPKFSFSFVTMFLNSSTLCNERNSNYTNCNWKMTPCFKWKGPRLLTFLCGMTCGMYCSKSWALFLPFSSSWNNRLGFRSLNATPQRGNYNELLNVMCWNRRPACLGYRQLFSVCIYLRSQWSSGVNRRLQSRS